MRQYLIPTPRPEIDLKRINDYFLTFLGEVKLPQMAIKGKQIIIDCPDDDRTSIPLIRNLSLRIFSPHLKAFLPNDPNLLEIDQTNPVFIQYGLKPIFRYRNSLVFFCRDKAGKIHLINRHLLEYLNTHPGSPRVKTFSLIVAKNIATFMALSDRGLIPLSYYQFSKITNLAGIPLTSKTLTRIICFQLDETNQTFVQNGRELTKIPKNYLAVKVNPDINYLKKTNRLIPQLNVSVFLA